MFVFFKVIMYHMIVHKRGDSMTEEFTDKLQKLAEGELEEIKISADDFMDFHEAFMNFPQRKRVVGIAGHKGEITYHFER